MMPGARRLFASFAALAASVAWLGDLGAYPEVEGEVLPSPTAPAPLNGIPVTVLDERTLQAIADRPLLSPDRRPWRPKPKPAPPTPAAIETPHPQLKAALLGVVLSPKGNTAILRIDGETSAVVAEGAMVGDWTLKRVSAGRVVLTSSGVEQEVAFTPHHGASTPSPVETSAAPSTMVRRRR